MKSDIRNYMVIPAVVTGDRAITDEMIIKAVEASTGVTCQQMKSSSRKREYVEARQIAIDIIKRKTGKSLKALGLMFGNRDHTTIIHSIRAVKDLRQADQKFNQKFNDVIRQLFNYQENRLK